MPSLLLWRTWCYVPSSAIYTWLYLPLHLPWMRPYFILPRKRQKHCFVLQGQCISFTRKPFSARLWEPQLFKLLSVKRKSEELSLFSTALSSWGKSLNHTVRSQTCTGFDCVRSHFSYSVATSQCTWVHSIWNDFERVLWRQCRPCLQDKDEGGCVGAGRRGSPRAVLTGWPWGSWGCGAAGSVARSGGCCCSCPAPPSRPRRAVPEESHVTNVTNTAHAKTDGTVIITAALLNCISLQARYLT